jgi:hypothetical protein
MVQFPSVVRKGRPQRQQVRFGSIADILSAYSITLSARPISVLGMMRPSVLAVFRLIVKSNLVDYTTDKSAGFVPLKTRPA